MLSFLNFVIRSIMRQYGVKKKDKAKKLVNYTWSSSIMF